ncbi:hypothetical protein NJB95_07415 [Brucella intermedia]|uniref:hypothetical protein n=1 Tax=Brucella intermedia TaxID=94625 RepID=UPI00209B714D|nr:hypothetical protein [Brucella intermedia]MCO7736438.1 hypothetical protein [Brucella intermedia]
MRKSAVIEILARRLRIAPGRIQAISERLASAGLISNAEGSRRYPPDLSEPEIVTLVIAVIADSGLGNVKATVDTFSTLASEGIAFGHVLQRVLFGRPVDIAHVIVRHDPAGVSAVIDGNHAVYGAEAPEKAATTARIIPGDALIAIAAEMQGQHPQQADALVELIRIRRAMHVSA